MRDKAKKIGRIKFAREVEGCFDGKRSDFIKLDEVAFMDTNLTKRKWEVKTHTAPNGDVWTRVNIKPHKTVLNRLKRWWAYLTT